MRFDIHKLFQEWARGTREPFNAEDAYCAGYEMAMRVKDEESRREDHPAIRSLRSLATSIFSF